MISLFVLFLDTLPAALSSQVPAWVTGIHLVLLVGMIIALALEGEIHAHKSVITGIAALIALLMGEFTHLFDVELFGEKGESKVPFFLEFIDWGVIAIILGSSLFVEITSKSGIFNWLAIRLTKLTKGDPIRLLSVYSLMTVLFSALLNNVTAMIIVGSLTVVSLEKLNRRELLMGFLLTEGLLTNVGGLLTLISSVPNIIVGNIAGISFLNFLTISAPYVVVTTIATLVLAGYLFKIRPLKTEAQKAEAAALIEDFDENDAITSRSFFILSWILFVGFILGLALTDLIPYVRDLGIGFVAMSFGILMLIRVKNSTNEVYARLDWDLLFFFAFLFVVIGVMEHAQVMALIGDGVIALMGLGDSGGPLALLWASSLASSVTDNIPLAAMLAKTMDGISQPFSPSYWWAVIYGANLGGNITPIGSASTVVAVTIMLRHGLKMSFMQFVKVAFPFAIMQLLMATGYVLILGWILD